MIETSAVFKEAVRADVRRTHLKLEMLAQSPDLEYTATEGSAAMGYSDADAMNDGEETLKRYATLEPSRWVLDGSFDVPPDEGTVKAAGYVLSALSGADGSFAAAQTVKRTFTGVDRLRALTVCFSDDGCDGTAEDFTVKVYQGEPVALTRTVTGNENARVVFDGFNVARPTAFEISITKWSEAGRRVRIAEVILGRREVWTENDLTNFAVKHQTDISCMSLPYGTCDLTVNDETGIFDPRDEYGIFDTLEDRQSVRVWVGVELSGGGVEYIPLGTFYQYNEGWKTGAFSRLVEWRLVDIIGLLAERDFSTHYSIAPHTLSGWAAAIVSQLGTAFANKYWVHHDYADMPVEVEGGGLISTCGDVLRMICLATDTFFRADSEGRLCIEPLPSGGGETGLSDLTDYPTYSANEEAASVTVGGVDEEISVTIRGNSAAATKNISIINPFLTDEDAAKAVARRILSAYGGVKYEIKGRGDPSREIGDVDTVTLERGTLAGRRIYQDFSYDGGVLRGCKTTLLRANGVLMYTKRVEFTESGTFTVPDGVTEIRIILVGGGTGGAWADGVPHNGAGGYVYEADIAVTAGDTYAVTIGTGGAAGSASGAAGGNTTFGEYSSLDGKRYEPSYIDLASGKTYGMRGQSRDPEANTGGGGYWQYAGADGAAIVYYREADGDA